MSILSACLVRDFSIVATCPSMLAHSFALCLCFIRFVFVVHNYFSGEPKQSLGRGSSSRPPSDSIAGSPKAALLFSWF